MFGTANSTTLYSGGIEVVWPGGTASGTTVNDGALEDILTGGTASGTTVNFGGLQIVEAGGTASNTTIYNGGIEHVVSGGTAVGTTINGGMLVLDAGATVGAVDFANGGTLQIGGTSIPAGLVVKGFAIGDVIDLSGLGFATGATATFDAGTHTLTVTSNTCNVYSALLTPSGHATRSPSPRQMFRKILLIPGLRPPPAPA